MGSILPAMTQTYKSAGQHMFNPGAMDCKLAIMDFMCELSDNSSKGGKHCLKYDENNCKI